MLRRIIKNDDGDNIDSKGGRRGLMSANFGVVLLRIRRRKKKVKKGATQQNESVKLAILIWTTV